MSAVTDIDVANLTKLKEFLDEHQHLMLLLRHDVILRDELKCMRKNSGDRATSKAKT